MIAISGSHTLLTNLVVAWNTHRMQETVDKWRRSNQKIEGKDHLRASAAIARLAKIVRPLERLVSPPSATRPADGASDGKPS